MNLLSTEVPKWDGIDASELKKFLNSSVGQKAVFFVSELCPPFLDGGDSGKTLVRSGEINGWQSCLASLFELVNTKPEELTAPEAYPSLDDESAWEQPQPKK